MPGWRELPSIESTTLDDASETYSNSGPVEEDDRNTPQTIAHSGAPSVGVADLLRERRMKKVPAVAQLHTADGRQQKITVCCRFRPENAQELNSGGATCVDFDPSGRSVSLRVGDTDSATQQKFKFNRVFAPNATQVDIFNYVAAPAIDDLVAGINVSILAYGQTGSGKTFTTLGEMGPKHTVVDQPGLFPRMIDTLFDRVKTLSESVMCTVAMSFVEIYMEEIRDLLCFPKPKAIKLRDGSGLHLTDCTSVDVTSASAAMEVVSRGIKVRSTAATNANELSSRSHAMLLLSVATDDGEGSQTVGQMYLVDLAGSEKVAKTETEGLRLEEAKRINTSLFALGQVIAALTKRRRGASHHVPYRDSKLTRLLENSLGGNARTFVIVTCSPSSFNDHETLESLKFAAKAQRVKTKPTKKAPEKAPAELLLLLDKTRMELEEQRAIVRAYQARDPTRTDSTPLSPSRAAEFQLRGAAYRRIKQVVDSIMVCPLTGHTYRDPVVCLDGHTYERKAIESHLLSNNMRSPITNERINQMIVTPNFFVRGLVAACAAEGVPVQDTRKNDCALPHTAFVVYLCVDTIVDFLPQTPSIFGLGSLNRCFARVIFNIERWRPLIAPKLCALTPELRNKATTIPAHRLFELLENGGVDMLLRPTAFSSKVTSSSKNVNLVYSSSARRIAAHERYNT